MYQCYWTNSPGGLFCSKFVKQSLSEVLLTLSWLLFVTILLDINVTSHSLYNIMLEGKKAMSATTDNKISVKWLAEA